MRPKVFFQNRVVEDTHARVSVFDHGFLYGDGIYETVRAYDGRVFHWPHHYRRLLHSARRIQLKCPWSSAYLLRGIQKLLKANQSPNASVRISVSRGPGPLGLDPRVCPNPTLVMLLHPSRDILKLQREGVTIGISDVRRNHPRSLDPQIKSNSALNTILAKMEGTQMGVFETILPNLAGYLTEGTTSNLFFVRDGELFTPSRACGLLAGVTRAAVLRLARSSTLKTQEGFYRINALKRADEIFLTSTTLEIVPVIRVLVAGKRPSVLWQARPGPVTHDLLALYRRQKENIK